MPRHMQQRLLDLKIPGISTADKVKDTTDITVFVVYIQNGMEWNAKFQLYIMEKNP